MGKIELIKKYYGTKANYYQKKMEDFKVREKYYENKINIWKYISKAVKQITASYSDN